MKIKIILLSFIIMACASIDSMGQSKIGGRKQNNEVTHVTPQMARKIKYAFDTNENIKGFIYTICRPNSIWEMHEKMEDMLKNPDTAKPIINQIFDIYGDGDYGKLNFLNGFGFSVNEVKIASKIYQEYTKDLEIQKADRKKQEELERQERLHREKTEEEALLERWNNNGVDFFSTFEDRRLNPPSLHIDLINIAKKYDENSQPQAFNEIGNSSVSFNIDENGELSSLLSKGTLEKVIEIGDITVDSPATFVFEHIDTIISVPCKYSFKIEDDLRYVDDLQCKVKFNKKKNLWEIQLLDKAGLFDDRYGVEEKYNRVYSKVKYNHGLSTSEKDAIAYATAKAINSNEDTKAALINGKHIVDISIYNHSLRLNNHINNRIQVFNKEIVRCQPFIVITTIN